MIQYYLSPKRDLIALDTETNEIFILPRIESVKVFDGHDIRIGDFKGGYGENQDGMTVGTRRDGPKQERKKNVCKKCGKAGHRQDNAQFHGTDGE